QSAISLAQRQLPPGMPTPPSFRKVNPADQPILFLALSSPTLPLSTVAEYAETQLAQRISMVTGVAQVQVFGSQQYAVRVQLDPTKLASRGLGIDDIEQALESGNVNVPTGALQGAHQTVTVQASGQLLNAAAYRPLIVAYRNGNPVRLEELGRVIDSVQNDKVANWFGETRAIVLPSQRHPGTHTGGRRRLDQGSPAGLPRPDPRLGLPGHPLRSVSVDSRLGRGRPVHLAPRHRARHSRDLPVPAEPLGHHHPEPRSAHVDRG